ncbi:MAG: hypothetical protein WD073_07630 [Xanthobacteraceae bacterium]
MRAWLKVMACLLWAAVAGLGVNAANAQSGLAGFWGNTQTHCPMIALKIYSDGEVWGWFTPAQGKDLDPEFPDVDGTITHSGSRVQMSLQDIVGEGRVSIGGTVSGKRMDTQVVLSDRTGSFTKSCLFELQ